MSAATMWLGSYLITINGSLLSLVLFNLGRLNVTHLIVIIVICLHRRVVRCTMFLCRFCHVATMICVSQFLLRIHRLLH